LVYPRLKGNLILSLWLWIALAKWLILYHPQGRWRK